MGRHPGHDVLSNAREHSDGGGSGGGDDGGGGDCDLLLILVLNSELLVCATIHKSLRVVFFWTKLISTDFQLHHDHHDNKI